jgi:hypothetical protein
VAIINGTGGDFRFHFTCNALKSPLPTGDPITGQPDQLSVDNLAATVKGVALPPVPGPPGLANTFRTRME